MTAPSGHLLMRCDVFEDHRVTSLDTPGETFLTSPLLGEIPASQSAQADFEHGLTQSPDEHAVGYPMGSVPRGPASSFALSEPAHVSPPPETAHFTSSQARAQPRSEASRNRSTE